ncbi:hypothetical protein CR51_26280 [Caballeronia megalochromosomata]|nr:hypothetical protein CR51_26280 [Caballeronia megalochromosomata]
MRQGIFLISKGTSMMQSYRPVVLRIYQTPDGKWAGRLMIGNEDLGWVTGLASATEVEHAIQEAGMHADHVEVQNASFSSDAVPRAYKGL